MANQPALLRLDSITIAGETVAPGSSVAVQIPQDEMGRPIPIRVEYHGEGELAGVVKVRVTGSHLEPSHNVTESAPQPLEAKGAAEIEFTPHAYGSASLFVFLNDMPVHISLFQLTERNDGPSVKVTSRSVTVRKEDIMPYLGPDES
jgi:hypothetical protein